MSTSFGLFDSLFVCALSVAVVSVGLTAGSGVISRTRCLLDFADAGLDREVSALMLKKY